MTGETRRLPGMQVMLWASAVLVLGSVPAHAQLGMGMGMGMGMGWGGIGGFNYTSSPTNFLNQQALQRGQRAGAPTSNRPYAGNPNAYYNSIRDNGFVPRYDVQARRTPAPRPRSPVSLAQTTSQPAATETAAIARPQPVIPLSSFFDADHKLAWPGESPVAGDLQAKRDVSDQATLSVLDETKARGTAAISSVADAREKLLEYGRPALQEVRAVATARVADTFHLFLLSLYESLAQAAASPQPEPAPTP